MVVYRTRDDRVHYVLFRDNDVGYEASAVEDKLA